MQALSQYENCYVQSINLLLLLVIWKFGLETSGQKFSAILDGSEAFRASSPLTSLCLSELKGASYVLYIDLLYIEPQRKFKKNLSWIC